MSRQICARKGCRNLVGPRGKKYCCGDCAGRQKSRNAMARRAATELLGVDPATLLTHVRHLEDTVRRLA